MSAIAPLLVLLRLWKEGLFSRRPYVAFTTMLAGGVVQDAVLLCAGDYRSHAYAFAWSITLAPILLLESWAALSTYQEIAQLYPKIGVFAVRLFRGALIATAIGCCMGLPFETRHIAGIEASVRTLFLLDRWMNSLMAGGLLLAVAYLSRFQRPLKVMPRNLTLHTALLCAYFSAYAIVPFVLNLVPLGDGLWVQIALLLGAIALYLTWAVRLSFNGEKTEAWPLIDERILEHVEQRHRETMQLGAALADSALRQASVRK